MPEPAVLDQAPPIAETAPSAAAEPVDLSAQPLAEELALAEAAAARYYEDQKVEAEPVRQRGPDGKFISTKPAEPAEPAEPTPAPVVGESPSAPAAPKLDPVWAEAARLEGFTADEIGKFKDDGDAQNQIGFRRYTELQKAESVLRRAGVDLDAVRQWKAQQGQPPSEQQPPAPTGQAAPVTPVEPFKLNLDENELAPELVKPLRAMETFANKVLAENQQLRQQVAQAETSFEQRVQAAERAAKEAESNVRSAAEADSAAKEIPGFVETLGLPSEINRLAAVNPYDPRVLNFNSYLNYVNARAELSARALGPQNVNPKRVMAEAFEASPFARLVGQTNGKSTNGTSAVGPGSVVRSAPRRGPSAEPTPQGDDLAAEMQRITDLAGQAWERSGVNPFAATGRS